MPGEPTKAKGRRPAARHACPNEYNGEGAKGACYLRITDAGIEGKAHLDVGYSCVGVHDAVVPVTWITELVAIATAHAGGIAGFLKEHSVGESYALACDPPEDNPPPTRRRR